MNNHIWLLSSQKNQQNEKVTSSFQRKRKLYNGKPRVQIILALEYHNLTHSDQVKHQTLSNKTSHTEASKISWYAIKSQILCFKN